MSRVREHGPDWEDVSIMLAEVGRLHEGHCRLTIVPGAGVYTSCLDIRLTFFSTSLDKRSRPQAYELTTVWPNKRFRSIETTVYRLAHELDAKLARELWVQAPIPLA